MVGSLVWSRAGRSNGVESFGRARPSRNAKVKGELRPNTERIDEVVEGHLGQRRLSRDAEACGDEFQEGTSRVGLAAAKHHNAQV